MKKLLLLLLLPAKVFSAPLINGNQINPNTNITISSLTVTNGVKATTGNFTTAITAGSATITSGGLSVTGDILFPTNNTYDIGKPNATAPKNVYVTNAVLTGDGSVTNTAFGFYNGIDCGLYRAGGLAFACSSKQGGLLSANDLNWTFNYGIIASTAVFNGNGANQYSIISSSGISITSGTLKLNAASRGIDAQGTGIIASTATFSGLLSGSSGTFTNTVTASSFSGSGFSLSNIPQSAVNNLTTDLASKASSGTDNSLTRANALATIGTALTVTSSVTAQGLAVTGTTNSSFYTSTMTVNTTGIITAASQPGSKARLLANQSIPDSTFVPLYITDETCADGCYDRNSVHDATNSSATFVARGSGVYFYNCQIVWEANATGLRYIYIADGVGLSKIFAQYLGNSNSANTIVYSAQGVGFLSDGQTVECIIRQTSGGSLNALGATGTYMNLQKLW